MVRVASRRKRVYANPPLRRSHRTNSAVNDFSSAATTTAPAAPAAAAASAAPSTPPRRSPRAPSTPPRVSGAGGGAGAVAEEVDDERVFDLEHDEARSIGVRTPPRTRREARAPEITKGKNKFRLSRPMHATDKQVEEARNPGKAAAKAKKQQRKKGTSKRVKRSRGDAKSEGPSKRQRGTAPSAKKRLSLPKGPVGRSTTGVRKPRVVPEVEAIKADGLSDETKINALMLRLRLGSELENALPHFSALETAMTTSRAIVRRSFAIKDVGRQEFLWCFRRALSVNQPNSTRQTGYARFVQDLRENAITEGADVEAAVAKARTEWRELPTDTKEEWAAKATEEFEEAGQTPDDEEIDDDAAVVGATAAKQTVYKFSVGKKRVEDLSTVVVGRLPQGRITMGHLQWDGRFRGADVQLTHATFSHNIATKRLTASLSYTVTARAPEAFKGMTLSQLAPRASAAAAAV